MGLQRWAGSCETLDATKHFLHTGDPPEYLRRAWIWVGRGSLWPQASPGGGGAGGSRGGVSAGPCSSAHGHWTQRQVVCPPPSGASVPRNVPLKALLRVSNRQPGSRDPPPLSAAHSSPSPLPATCGQGDPLRAERRPRHRPSSGHGALVAAEGRRGPGVALPAAGPAHPQAQTRTPGPLLPPVSFAFRSAPWLPSVQKALC